MISNWIGILLLVSNCWAYSFIHVPGRIIVKQGTLDIIYITSSGTHYSYPEPFEWITPLSHDARYYYNQFLELKPSIKIRFTEDNEKIHVFENGRLFMFILLSGNSYQVPGEHLWVSPLTDEAKEFLNKYKEEKKSQIPATRTKKTPTTTKKAVTTTKKAVTTTSTRAMTTTKMPTTTSSSTQSIPTEPVLGSVNDNTPDNIQQENQYFSDDSLVGARVRGRTTSTSTTEDPLERSIYDQNAKLNDEQLDITIKPYIEDKTTHRIHTQIIYDLDDK